MKVNLQTRMCNCGYEFQTKDIKPPLNRVPKGFYGGNVDRTCATTCPECDTAYDLWIKQAGQTWKVVTLAGEPVGEVVETEQEQEQEPIDAFDGMDKLALREWLEAREVKYHAQLGEKKLRELCRNVLAESSDIKEESDEE